MLTNLLRYKVEDIGLSPCNAAFDFYSLPESWRKIVRKLLCVITENRWKIQLFSKYSVRSVGTRQINCRKIPLILKYSVIIVGTRQNNLIYMLKKFSIPLTSESVTSGQADGVFCQLFLQCVQDMLLLYPHIFSGDEIFENHHSTVTLPAQQPSPAHHLTHTQREPTKDNKTDLNVMSKIR